ncbi:serine/threonine-protein kinase [Cognatilysobacter tabacisoli]|uniref:serine/threonine-protein kinase n=1 Tax=Cognatilysobacter tabacisoli TaxID=2315424 RepID=UPI000E6B1E17|nr:serine/threonine-protein kinase [Lysobacter tabacisoli]
MSDPAQPTATGLYAQQQLAPGSVLAGRFRIEATLGIGGMGVVYRATDLALDVPVAVKLLRPELASRPDAFERFRQELLMARQVSSPRVVRIHDLAQHEDQWLISMDLVDGEGLDRVIDRDGALPPDEAARIARQLAEALSAAHARGVIHRDLKPANVLLDRERNAYVGDFGVARSLAGSGRTQSGTIVGTPDYLSPEQARGEPVDARSDLYALGLITYEMLTGEMPFSGGTVSEILAQRMLRSPPPVSKLRPDTPSWLVRLVDRLLRPQPAHRLQSADAVIRAIDRREVPRDWRPGPRAWAVAAAVALASIAAFGWWRLQQQAPAAGGATVAPLDRVLVLPVEAPDSVPAARVAAWSALVRDTIGAVPGSAVVDEERTLQALRQLDPTGNARPDAAALQRIAGANRALRITLRPAGSGWEASADVRGTGATQAARAGGSTPAQALAAVVAEPALAQALRLSRPPPALPTVPEAGLDGFGNALLAVRGDAPADAIAPLRAVVESTPDFAAGWLLLADAAGAVGDMDGAYDALERGGRAAKSASPAQQRRLRAQTAMLDGDAAAAAAEWRAQLQATPDDTFADLQLARALGGGGDLPAAIARLQALTQRDANDPRAWFELGKFSILQGQAQRAVDEHLVRALVLYKRSGNRFGEAETVNALGIGYNRLGQSDDAEEQYRKAVELRRAVGNRRGLATSLRNLASVLSTRGQYDEAATTLESARALHAELGDRGGLAAVENELGLLDEERGDYRAALEAFRRALQGWQQIGDPSGTAQVLNNIGFAHFQLGAYADAQAYLVQAAQAYDELGDDTGRIRTQQNLGLLAIARGQWTPARDALDRSLASAEQQQMFEEAAVSRRNLAELELLQGNLDAALSQAGKAEALFAQRDDPRGRADAGLLRVQALLAAHADAQAGEALRALAPSVAQASEEQRGIDALLRAEVARRTGATAAWRTALDEAQRHAQASGVQLLQLQVALQRERTPALETATVGLGHVGLRLAWTELAMGDALARGDAARAVTLYRAAQPLLRRGAHLNAHAIHRAGARALAATGDADAAGAADDDATASLQALRARVPDALRAGFDRATAPSTATAQG